MYGKPYFELVRPEKGLPKDYKLLLLYFVDHQT